MDELKLTIELIPPSSWGSDLKKVLSQKMWANISNSTRVAAGWKCEICDAKPTRQFLHTHEKWEFHDVSKAQILRGLVSICVSCHNIKHFGRSQMVLSPQQIEDLIQHFIRVNNCDRATFYKHKEETFSFWKQRKEYLWHIDFGEYNDEVNRKKIEENQQKWQEKQVLVERKRQEHAQKTELKRLVSILQSRYHWSSGVLLNKRTRKPIRRITIEKAVGGESNMALLLQTGSLREVSVDGVIEFDLQLNE